MAARLDLLLEVVEVAHAAAVLQLLQLRAQALRQHRGRPRVQRLQQKANSDSVPSLSVGFAPNSLKGCPRSSHFLRAWPGKGMIKSPMQSLAGLGSGSETLEQAHYACRSC